MVRLVETLARRRDVAESAPGHGARVFGRHSVGDELLGLDGDVRLDLAIEVTVAAGKRPHTLPPGTR